MKHLYLYISLGLFSLPVYGVDSIMLAHFKVDDISWSRKGKNLFAKKEISVEAIIHSINLEIEAPTVNVSFSLNGVHLANVETIQLFPQKASFVLQEEERYDPKKNHHLKEYVDKLFQNPIKGVQQFWSEEVDLDNIGSIKLIFQRDRNIRYHKTEADKSWKLQHDEEFLHKSVITIPYGFEGEEATNTQDIFTMEHEEQLVEHPNIWFLDNQRWLKRTKAVEYTTIRSDLVEWAKANNIPVRKYSVLEPGKGEVFVLYPFSETTDPLPKFIPEGEALNQYYRLGEGMEQQVSHYIYYDNDRGLFKPQGSLFKCYLQEMGKNELKFTFKNKKDEHTYIYTVKQSQEPIILPPRTGSGGQVVKDREFKKGLYRLLNTQQPPTGDIMQIWGEEPDNGENVTIRFSGIYANGKRASLTKYPGVVSTTENMLDLSNYLHTFKASEFDELKHYLHTIFWIEQKEPVVKYYHPEIEIDQLRQANNYLNNLIREIRFLRIKLNSGYLLTYEEEEKWALRIADANYLSDGTCLLSLNSQLLIDTIKNLPALRELDLATITIPNLPSSSFFTFLTDEQRIEHVGIKTLTRDIFKEIGLTDSQIIKLAIKSRSLEHLDVSGIKGLCEQGDQFIAAIRLMKNLQSLNVLKADLSNSQTVALSKVLLDKEQLKNVKLTLPYVASNALPFVRDLYKHSWDHRDAKGGWALLAIDVLLSPIMVPAVATIMAGFDMLGMPYWNDPFVFTYRALASIPSLETLTLETSGIFDRKGFIENEIKDLRANRIRNKSLGKKSSKLSPVSIEFFK
ncbi:MAG: hypothetical protein ACH349_04145 [Candidatus Rhabdochlamydia sp.]